MIALALALMMWQQAMPSFWTDLQEKCVGSCLDEVMWRLNATVAPPMTILLWPDAKHPEFRISVAGKDFVPYAPEPIEQELPESLPEQLLDNGATIERPCVFHGAIIAHNVTTNCKAYTYQSMGDWCILHSDRHGSTVCDKDDSGGGAGYLCDSECMNGGGSGTVKRVAPKPEAMDVPAVQSGSHLGYACGSVTACIDSVIKDYICADKRRILIGPDGYGHWFCHLPQ